MYKVVGIRFKKAGKVYYFDPGEIDLAAGDAAIVETARGVEYGDVVVAPKMVPDEEIVAPLKQVIRKATEADKVQLSENEKKEEKAFGICQQKIAAHGLPMKLVDVEYTFDNNKIIFYFTAEERVDFRELVKDLAGVFRTRIELRQIGVRDEAKMLGGLGPCGRSLCCRTFLGDFEPVSIRMAKEQNLSLNPTKISGICGRLMCCLKFESYDRDEKSEVASPACGACDACDAAEAGAPPPATSFGEVVAPEELEELEKLEEMERMERHTPKEEPKLLLPGADMPDAAPSPRSSPVWNQPRPRTERNRDNQHRNGSNHNNGNQQVNRARPAGRKQRHKKRPMPLQGRQPARVGGHHAQNPQSAQGPHGPKQGSQSQPHHQGHGQGHGRDHGPARGSNGTNGAGGRPAARGKVSGPESNSSKGSS